MKLIVTILLVMGSLPFIAFFAFFVWFRAIKTPKPPYKQPSRWLKPLEWKDDQVTVGWVGHSTVCMNVYGTKIMTDPVLGNRVGQHLDSEGRWQVGPRRHTAPALSPEDAGRIDLILLSHAHFDHFDIPTLTKLASPDTRVITAKGTSHLLKNIPFGQVTELDGEESVLLDDGVKVTAVPVKHWGNRYPWNRSYGHTGYLIEKNGTRIFYPGDTAYTPGFRKLRETGEIDLAFMPIGAYAPDALLRAHCTPEQAWEMFLDTGARWLVPIHWDTFVLSHEPVDEPIRRLLEAAGDQQDRIVIREHGAVFQFVKTPVISEGSPFHTAG
ncbi:MBL fold metallo-hydrolase [Lihuaxuella thermophila]|uniref:L-ascorbate metabolism protein UlaG, beta-lactamase superfamily n=1 Tax=Lihuaxuella thermophila TaxID=1173111 RepID=A0A1H8H7E7_9BACL|nr:MBL fold metallo-hydrolase [Lihuaxuella thermophila]SEN51667.1 L-ascorbate metabolism protein UlaG, beta-lactamase superfamily [Lihuaxuella thermophila]